MGPSRYPQRCKLAAWITSPSLFSLKRSYHLDPGDVLVLYTDGITEARNDQGAFFGEERLLSTLSAHPRDEARQIERVIMGAVDAFMDGSVRSDDITLAVVVRNL